MKNTQAPALYRKLSEPFASNDAAEAAIEAFYNDLTAIRAKHRIPDLSIVAQVNVLTEGDLATPPTEVEKACSMHYGNKLNQVPMLAMALGQARRSLDEELGKLIKR